MVEIEDNAMGRCFLRFDIEMLACFCGHPCFRLVTASAFFSLLFVPFLNLQSPFFLFLSHTTVLKWFTIHGDLSIFIYVSIIIYHYLSIYLFVWQVLMVADLSPLLISLPQARWSIAWPFVLGFQTAVRPGPNTHTPTHQHTRTWILFILGPEHM